MLRIVAAIGISLPLALLFGMILSFKRSVVKIVAYTIMPIPKAALLPPLIIIFGLGELSKIILLVICICFPMIISVSDAVQEIRIKKLQPFIAAGTSQFFIAVKIMPFELTAYIVAALKQSLATAMSVLFFAESFGTDYGMGFYILDRFIRADYTSMTFGIVAMSLCGAGVLLLLDLLMYLINRKRAGGAK